MEQVTIPLIHYIELVRNSNIHSQCSYIDEEQKQIIQQCPSWRDHCVIEGDNPPYQLWRINDFDRVWAKRKARKAVEEQERNKRIEKQRLIDAKKRKLFERIKADGSFTPAQLEELKRKYKL